MVFVFYTAESLMQHFLCFLFLVVCCLLFIFYENRLFLPFVILQAYINRIVYIYKKEGTAGLGYLKLCKYLLLCRKVREHIKTQIVFETFHVHSLLLQVALHVCYAHEDNIVLVYQNIESNHCPHLKILRHQRI